jgi:16S rRNA (guanine1516-N2)-methyltransferase
VEGGFTLGFQPGALRPLGLGRACRLDGVVDRDLGCAMALVGVEALTGSAQPRAAELAQQWHVPLAPHFKDTKGVKVLVSDLTIGLGFVDSKRGKPYYIDFLSRVWKARLHSGLPKSHIFRRALGYKGEPLRVIDATAGFGQDAMLALCLGCEVIAVERSPVVVTILRNGVMRAMRDDETVRGKFENLSVVEADALVFLGQVDAADVVYLDPMFDKPKKSAKSPKEMQLLQELLGPPPSVEDEEKLFHKAFANARQRVVVKRPLKGKALVRTPSHSFKGQSIRYDVYIK